MVISRALSSIEWLVLGLHGLKLGECVVVHWDAGSMCAWRRVLALSTSPRFGNVPDTKCNFDGALLRDRQDNWATLVVAMPFLDGCVSVSFQVHPFYILLPLAIEASAHTGRLK